MERSHNTVISPSDKKIWDEVISYGSSNRCSVELAIACVVEDEGYSNEIASRMFDILRKYRNGTLKD